MAAGSSNNSRNNSNSNVVCPYFIHSSCREGDACPRSHDVTAWTPDRQPLCRFYLYGDCKYESKCWYSHGSAARRDPIAVSSSDPDLPQFTIRIVPTRNPNKPPAGRTAADTPKPNQRSGRGHLRTIELCNFHMTGECPFAERCHKIHGDICDLCQLKCMHPYNPHQRALHTAECEKELERNMELSFAVQRSKEKTCGICLDVIIEKEPISERRFGILEGCNHVFCLECIRKWRRVREFEGESTVHTIVNPNVTRMCPTCRVPSDFITPSQFWVDAEAKEKLIRDYKNALSRKHCKYYKQGAGRCPFGGLCFYLHALPDGSKVDLPPPRRRRAANHSIENNPLIVEWDPPWEFLDGRDGEVGTVRDILDFYEDFEFEDDDSDFDDHLSRAYDLLLS